MDNQGHRSHWGQLGLGLSRFSENFIAKAISLHEYFTTSLQHTLFIKIMLTLHMRLHCAKIFHCRNGQKIDSSSHKLVEIDDKSHQPKLPVFPKRKCGIKDRCFQHDWFEKWSWLYYNELNDAACCFTRIKAIKEKKVKTGNIDAFVVSSGFTNWKDATCAFERHEVSDAHKATIEVNLESNQEYKNCSF